MELIEHGGEERLNREAAAQRLGELADELARHNEISFMREGIRHSVKVPSEISYAVEIEVNDDGSEIEIELKW